MAARIRDHDWAATPLGPVRTWSERFELMVEQVLANPLVSSLVCGPERVLVYNDAAARLYGDRHPAALGRPLPETFPDGWATVAPFYERAFAGEAVQVAGQPLDTRGEGVATEVFDALLMPVREADGRIACVHMTGIEVGDRARTEAALRESEARYRRLFESMNEGFVVGEFERDADGRPVNFRYLELNPALEQLSGLKVNETVGRWITEVLPPEDARYWIDAFGSVLLSGKPARFEHRVEALSMWFGVNVTPVGPNRIATIYENITERKRAEAAQRESEIRQAILLRLSDALRPLIDADEIQRVAARLAAEHWGMAGANSVRIETRHGVPYAIVRQSYVAEGREAIDGDYPLADFPGFTSRMLSGEAMIVPEVASDPNLTERDKANWKAMDLATLLSVSLVKGGRLVACFAVHGPRPKPWTIADAQLLEDIAERTWAAVERSRAEAALRESEARYQALFAASPVPFMVLAANPPDFTITAANDAYFAATLTTRETLIGRRLFDVFTDDPSRPGQLGSEALDISLERVLRTRRTDAMERVRYDIRTPSGGFEEHWWLAINAPLLDPAGNVTAIIHQVDRQTELHHAEAALRGHEERQAFLLELADALRPLNDPVAAQGVAAWMLGAELQVDRCYYAEFDWPRDVLHIAQEYVGSASFSVVGEHPISAFQDLLVHSHRGEPLVCDDIATHPVFSGEIAAYRERGTDGFILIPLVKQGVMVACMCVTMATPRAWSPAEVELVREVGDRTWEAAQRIRAEGATRESEERFAQFAASSADALWIRDAATLTMEYVSPAIATIYGIEPESFLNGVKVWASAIVPEDRDVALEHLEQARQGEAVVHEFRIQRPSDGSFRWIRDTDFPLHDAQGRVQRIGGIAQDVTEAKLSVEHQGVLLAELQHRVRNIMAQIRSITARTGERAESVPEYAALMAGRLMTFARVQALLTRGANVGVAVADIVRDELAAQAGHEEQYAMDGPAVLLSPKAAEVLTLAVHELATNALKYGGLSVPEGRVTVHWATFERRGTSWLGLDWIETSAPEHPQPDPATPRRRGFGSDLIEGRIPYELGGRGRVDIEAGGARCRLEFPLREGASILETDAPRRASVFGGAIDMAGEADLSGQRILVVEDDYFLASDTARALRGCGAEVLGPCPTEAAAREEMAEATPTGAVLDLNLGEGVSFALAAELHTRAVPFVMVSGYDEEVIPPEYAAVPRLQKPVQLKQVVGALATALRAAP